MLFLLVRSPERMGLLDPATSDGRVIFFLPWQNVTLAGTTDNACDITFQPAPTEKEIQFILNEVRNYLHPDVEGMYVQQSLGREYDSVIKPSASSR